MPFEDIRYSFLQLEPYFLDEQIILNLLKFLPTEEEKKKLSAYQELEEIEKLGIPEQFCIQVQSLIG